MDNKYQNCKIYKIADIGYNKFYIGSACEELCRRMSHHRAKFKRFLNGSEETPTRSYDIFNEYGVENCKIELIEYYKCDTLQELRKREGEIIKNTECINKNVAGRTRKEYYEDNKNNIKEMINEYLENNKDKIAQKRKTYYETEALEELKYWYVFFWYVYYLFVMPIFTVALLTKSSYHFLLKILIEFIALRLLKFEFDSKELELKGLSPWLQVQV